MKVEFSNIIVLIYLKMSKPLGKLAFYCYRGDLQLLFVQKAQS